MMKRKIFYLLLGGIIVSYGVLFGKVRGAISDGDDPFLVYLPFLSRPYVPQNIFGVDGMYALSASSGFQQMVEANAGWMRPYPPLLWSEVEGVPGDYNWAKARSFEENVKKIREAGIEVIAVVQSTPEWAQAIEGVFCGRIQPSKLEAFGRFLYAAVQRYSQSPYSVRFWEIWNEPDVDPKLVPPNSGFGCWGDQSDWYYGGEYYSQMLGVAYRKVKEANPDAFVVVGGLLLDCDPRQPPGGRDCRPSRFFEGILREGSGRNFDGVALHDYEFYGGDLGKYSNYNWNSSWETTGPSLVAKIRYLKDLLDQYQVRGKFLISTENALLCDLCVNDSTFEETKAIFLVQAYALSISEGLWGNMWHRVGDWRNSGLMNPDLSPRPAYYAFRYMSSVIEGYQFSRKIDGYEGVVGLEFQKDRRAIWILWSRNGQTRTVNLPSQPGSVSDIYGTLLPISLTYEISVYPIYFFFD